jgi:hypothetical protein
MFCNFYLVKSHKISKNSATTKAREKISTDLEFLEFKNNLCLFDKRLIYPSNFKQQFCNKVGHLREYTFFVCLVNLQA